MVSFMVKGRRPPPVADDGPRTPPPGPAALARKVVILYP